MGVRASCHKGFVFGEGAPHFRSLCGDCLSVTRICPQEEVVTEVGLKGLKQRGADGLENNIDLKTAINPVKKESHSD